MRIENLSLSFGTQEIFRNVNLNIKENQKVGIVGVNGAGKTTLFRVILGEVEPDSGKVVLKNDSRVSLLPQVISDEVSSMDINVFDYLESGRPIKKLESELQSKYDKLLLVKDEKKQKIIFKDIDKIQKELINYDYYTADSELLKIIYGMH